MSKFKSSLILVLCLVVAVIVLYSRVFISRNSQAPPREPSIAHQPTADVITIHYHERPPYYVTGHFGVYGICADPAKLVFNKAGIPFHWQKTPAKRQLDIIKSNRAKECLLGWFKNKEREKFAKYSLCIYQDKPAIALARFDNQKIVSGRFIEAYFSNPNLTLLRKDGYSYGRFVDKKIAEFNPEQKITIAENVGMLKMIHAGRADYFFIGEDEAEVLIASSGLPKTDFKYVRFSDMPEGNKRYILFSKKVEDEVVHKINTAIKKYIHGGSEL